MFGHVYVAVLQKKKLNITAYLGKLVFPFLMKFTEVWSFFNFCGFLDGLYRINQSINQSELSFELNCDFLLTVLLLLMIIMIIIMIII